MCHSKLLIEQVIHLVVVYLKVATLNNENPAFSLLSDLNLLEQLLQPMDQNAFIFEAFQDGRFAAFAFRG